VQFSVSDAAKDRINPIFCVVSHATVTSDTENHGSCKHPLSHDVYLNNVRQACALVGVKGSIQSIREPGAQLLNLFGIPALKEGSIDCFLTEEALVCPHTMKLHALPS
jgi:hypothetical protein